MNRATRRRIEATRRRRRDRSRDTWENTGEQSAISDQDAEAVIMAMLRGYHPDPVPEDDLEFAVSEVCKLRAMGAMAEMIVEGWVNCRIKDGELTMVIRPGVEDGRL